MDLAGYPLRPKPNMPGADVDEMRPHVMEGLESLDLRFFRIADLGLVSELGEGREDFRRRAMGLLRPELQSRIDSVIEQPISKWPWRGNSQQRKRESARNRMAAELATLANSIEEFQVTDVAGALSRAEVGTLLVPGGAELAPPRYRDLMV